MLISYTRKTATLMYIEILSCSETNSYKNAKLAKVNFKLCNHILFKYLIKLDHYERLT